MPNDDWECSLRIFKDWLIEDFGNLNMELEADDFFDLNQLSVEDKEKLGKGLVEVGHYILIEHT